MDIVEATRVMVNDYMSRLDPSHDMYHVERVRRLALYLADQDDLKGKVDLQVIELAALCHDIGDRKYAADHEDQKCVYAFLARHGYPKAELVQRIVDHVGFRKELGWNDMQDEPEQVRWRNECLELHAVQDADKLDAIGAFGVMRCAAYSGAKSIPLHVPGLDPISGMMTKEQYETQTVNKTGCAVNHFYEKLFRLSSMMRTKRGRAMAEERDRFMREFVARIEKEYEMQL